MREPQLVLVILAVRDLPRMRSFYTALLGWQQVVDTPVYVELSSSAGLRLGLYQDEAFSRNTGEPPAAAAAPASTTRTELYLHCEDLDNAVTRAEPAGARTLAARSAKPWGDEAVYLADPEGNVVVLARPLAPGMATKPTPPQ